MEPFDSIVGTDMSFVVKQKNILASMGGQNVSKHSIVLTDVVTKFNI